ISIVRLSYPAWAMTSAENGLGTCSQPFTTVPPSFQMVLKRFSLTAYPPLGCRIYAAKPSIRGRVPLASRATSGDPGALRDTGDHQRGDQGHPHEPGDGTDERKQEVEERQNGCQEAHQRQPPRQDAAT